MGLSLSLSLARYSLSVVVEFVARFVARFEYVARFEFEAVFEAVFKVFECGCCWNGRGWGGMGCGGMDGMGWDGDLLAVLVTDGYGLLVVGLRFEGWRFGIAVTRS